MQQGSCADYLLGSNIKITANETKSVRGDILLFPLKYWEIFCHRCM